MTSHKWLQAISAFSNVFYWLKKTKLVVFPEVTEPRCHLTLAEKTAKFSKQAPEGEQICNLGFHGSKFSFVKTLPANSKGNVRRIAVKAEDNCHDQSRQSASSSSQQQPVKCWYEIYHNHWCWLDVLINLFYISLHRIKGLFLWASVQCFFLSKLFSVKNNHCHNIATTVFDKNIFTK